ncbi:MAG: cupin domain-containing protein [Candidatus Nephthysia bennettiae]|nr:MAG: cupin domain-containing protein [Candidatus Dormibacteraeota bacterium]
MEGEMFDSLHALRPYAIWDGAVARAVHGEQLTMAVVELQRGVAVPEHRHVNEQLGFVARGSITMTIGGESRELGVGETYVIATDVPHAAVAGADGATVVDVFSPPRADWQGLERLEPGRAAWP